MDALKSALIGLGSAAIAWGTLNLVGMNYIGFSILLYLYIAAPVLTYLAMSDLGLKDLMRMRSRLLYVVDEEERRVKKVLSGEEFKINDSERL
jgi:uncharacterized membrane protein